MIADDDILVNAIVSTGGLGLKRLAVTHGPDGWTASRTLDLERLEAVLQ